MIDTPRIHLLNLDLEGLAGRLQESLGLSSDLARRNARLVFRGFWVRPDDPRQSWDLAPFNSEVRSWLTQSIRWDLPTLRSKRTATDGTQKFLFELGAERRESETVEAVLIGRGLKPSSPQAGPGRSTLCVSSQVGCAMKCAFCLTGAQGLTRSLSPSEILGQVAAVKAAGFPVSHIVFMGMGEPFQNLQSTLAVCKALQTPEWGPGLSRRSITISTSGILPGIRALRESGLGTRLAISLNASQDSDRDALMPVNRRWPIAELLNEARHYATATRTKVMFEYVLLKDRTDRSEDLERLLEMFHESKEWAQINLIPFNAFPGALFEAPERGRPKTFQHALIQSGITTTVRASGGPEILAACGQLREVSLSAASSV